MRVSLAILLLAGAVAARAEEPLLLREARQAVREAVPPVALLKLRTLLAQAAITGPEREAATLLLGEALALDGQGEDALTAIQPLVAAGNQRALFLRAGILARLGRWAEARPLYHAAAGAPGLARAALLGEAEALQALGNTEEAATLLASAVRGGDAEASVRLRLATLYAELGQRKKAQEALSGVQPATPEEAKWKRFAEGRLLLIEDQPAPALTIFERILQEREHLPEPLLAAATFGASDARIALHGSETADAVLETFIWRHPLSTYLEAAFRRLDQVYAQEDDPPEIELHKWAQKPHVRRAALARFYVAKMQVRMRKWDKAASSLDAFFRTSPAHPYVSQAQVLRAEVHSAKGNYAEAVRALEAAMRFARDAEQRATIELRTGLASFQQGEFLLAATHFEAAGRNSGKLRAVATFNAALAWLHQRNYERFIQQYRAFQQQQPGSVLRGELLLEEGLVQARTGDARAKSSLETFLRDFANDPRQAEARLAIAELAFLDGNAPDTPMTAQFLQATSSAAPAPEIAASADYLAIFQADSQTPPNDAQVIALAQKYLREHPGSLQTPEVRMKLGQVHFRREDFANAETQFEALTRESPKSPYLEAALYLAGESAMKLLNPRAVDRALEYFERVVKLDGAFKLYARQEQAIVQSRLGHEDQAIALYDLILAAQPAPAPELHYAALSGKGDNLLSLGRRALPATEKIEQAIAAYGLLAEAPNVPAAWRNQALYKKGKALEQLSRGDESLAAYYDVLNRTTSAEREFFWFFKAGFDAARLFEQQEQWKSAAGIYQKMAKIEGPRTAEAKSRLRQLRLEHFLWD